MMQKGRSEHNILFNRIWIVEDTRDREKDREEEREREGVLAHLALFPWQHEKLKWQSRLSPQDMAAHCRCSTVYVFLAMRQLQLKWQHSATTRGNCQNVATSAAAAVAKTVSAQCRQTDRQTKRQMWRHIKSINYESPGAVLHCCSCSCRIA